MQLIEVAEQQPSSKKTFDDKQNNESVHESIQ